MKLLTISIAAYNVEKYLRKTLESLRCSDDVIDWLEVLIEDDGSTDRTFDIAKEYEDMYPTVYKVIRKVNGGYGSTINNSIRIAHGKYFKQLDGDDWYKTENLELFLRWLSTIDSDFVITPYYNCFENGNIELIDNCTALKLTSEDISIMNLCGNFAMHELTIKTNLLKENNINITEKCFYTDNEYTFLPLLFAKTVSKYEKPLYCYRLGRSGQSVSIEGAKKHYKDSAVVAKKLYKAYSDNKDQCKKIDMILKKKLCYITDTVYTYYIIAAKEDNGKKFLKDFDLNLKQQLNDIYIATYSIKKVKLLRMTNFLTYRIIKNRLCAKWG